MACHAVAACSTLLQPVVEYLSTSKIPAARLGGTVQRVAAVMACKAQGWP